MRTAVDGDLWHGNPEEPRRRGRDTLADLFPTRTEWWVEKINRNVERDQRVNAQLTGAGWTVIRAQALAALDRVTSLFLFRPQWRLRRCGSGRPGPADPAHGLPRSESHSRCTATRPCTAATTQVRPESAEASNGARRSHRRSTSEP